MVFGEIVEPLTRALIDDEFEDYPEYVKPELVWDGNFDVPSVIDTLYFIESVKILKLCEVSTLKHGEKICTLKNGAISIYNVRNNKYIVSYIEKDLTTGEIIEILTEWLKKACHIYTITSEPMATYQNVNLHERPETLIRMLSTNMSKTFNYDKLESPNLVTGLGADVLSFCIHVGLKANLYVIYMDNSPLDSINVNPVKQLMNSIGLPLETPQNLNTPSSNLYL